MNPRIMPTHHLLLANWLVEARQFSTTGCQEREVARGKSGRFRMDSRAGDGIYIPTADRAALTLKTRILLALGCVDEDAPPSRDPCVQA